MLVSPHSCLVILLLFRHYQDLTLYLVIVERENFRRVLEVLSKRLGQLDKLLTMFGTRHPHDIGGIGCTLYEEDLYQVRRLGTRLALWPKVSTERVIFSPNGSLV